MADPLVPTPPPQKDAPAKASAFMHTMRMDMSAANSPATKDTRQAKPLTASPSFARPTPSAPSNGAAPQRFQAGPTNTSGAPLAPIAPITSTAPIPPSNASARISPGANTSTSAIMPKKIGPTYAEPQEITSTKEDFKPREMEVALHIPDNASGLESGGADDDGALIIDNANWPTYAFSAAATSTASTSATSNTPNTQKPEQNIQAATQPIIPKITLPPRVSTPTTTLMPTAPISGTPSQTPSPASVPSPTFSPSSSSSSSFQKGIDQRTQPYPPRIDPTSTSTQGNRALFAQNESENKPVRPQNTIRTFTSDVVDSVQGGMTMSDIAVAEARQRRAKGFDEYGDNAGGTRANYTKRIVFAVGGLLLLGGGSLALWIGYKRFIDVPTVAPVTVIVPPIIKSESSENIILDGLRSDDVRAVLRSEVESANLPIGAMKELPLYALPSLLSRPQPISTTKNEAAAEKTPLPVKLTASETMKTLGPTVAPSLLRSLEDEFYFGVYHNIGNNAVLILRTSTPEIVYRDMLAWEKSQNMVKELQNIFLNADERLKPPFFMATESGATYEFKDAVIDNRDIRVLVNAVGDIVLMYGFLDNQTLIITTNKLALREAYNRIVLGKLVR